MRRSLGPRREGASSSWVHLRPCSASPFDKEEREDVFDSGPDSSSWGKRNRRRRRKRNRRRHVTSLLFSFSSSSILVAVVQRSSCWLKPHKSYSQLLMSEGCSTWTDMNVWWLAERLFHQLVCTIVQVSRPPRRHLGHLDGYTPTQ